MTDRHAMAQMYGPAGVARVRSFVFQTPAPWSNATILVGTDHKPGRPRRLQDSS
jgi:hypothetical protein